ncbi:fimbrial assembly protein [Pseudomonas fluorescens]|uniref:Fimbrial assembly protein n=1 Tax=Pseudomonas fluorescens TaxID=294 RepID=A0A327NFY9_PSEFL|nr:CS1 type fimbrial major subunit [Pseudomonas fluorescens]RAI71488.1 fimbrial assembly protein [Pseudomonas fluorescens]
MFKKIAIATPMAILALSSSMAFAVGEARHSINIVAKVPTNTFHVLPVDPDLIGKDQHLSYNPITDQLSTLRAQFDTKNTNGSIHAMLESEAYLSNGVIADKVPLTVTFNNKTLSQTAPVEVVGEAESTPGARVDLVITPTKPATGGYKPGDYTGVVAMRFDAVLPVTH